MSSKGKRALVIGASRGVGRAVALALVADGARVCAVARSRENLDQLAKEAAGELLALAGDASDREFLAKAFTDADPDIVVSTLGVSPKLGTIEEQDWDSFSAAWNTDVKHAFHLSQLALSRPLRPGSIVVTFSSGAAIGGSPLSGGYAGAKRMQWFLAGYAAAVSKQKGLNIRFLALLPKQLLVGTDIGGAAGKAYAAAAGLSTETFFSRWEKPLDANGVKDAVLQIIAGAATDVTAIGVGGKGLEPL